MGRKVRKRTFGHVRPAKIQISLRIRAVWSESSLGAFWIAEDAAYLRAGKEDSNQTSDYVDAQADLCARWPPKIRRNVFFCSLRLKYINK